MPTRRNLLAVAAGTLAAPPIVRPKAPDTLTIGFFPSARPAMIAKGLGWFQDGAKAKVIWNEVGGGAEINSAFASGTIDVAVGIGSLPAAAGLSQGIPYRLVGVEANVGQAEDLTVRHAAGIRKPADLKGKRIGVPFGSTSHYRLLTYLRLHNLAPGDVILLDLRPDPMVAAWGRGEIDAGYIWNPVRGKLLAAGGDAFDTAHELDAGGYLIADLIAARGVFLDQYPDSVSGLLKAYGRAMDLWKAKPVEAAEDVARQIGVPPDAVQSDMADYDFPPLKLQAGPAWLADHGKLAPALKRCADFLVEQKSLRSAPAQAAFEKAIDASALTRAIAS